MSSFKRIARFGLLAAILVATALVWVNKVSLYDWYRLRGYTPATDVAKIPAQTSMTDYAKHMFYVNRPAILTKASFNDNCPNNGGEQTIVLGCYHDHETGIYLFKVTDPKLDGVIQVTAAHETLHAIYDRLSTAEKSRVDTMLSNYYKTVTDKRIIKTINDYKKSEPNDVLNEMHSIFGTEISALPKALETYYAKYFANRQIVVGFAQKYQQAFTSRQQQVVSYDAQIKALLAKISQNKTTLTQLLTRIESQKAVMDQERASKQYSAYNSQVGDFNSRVRQYNSLASTTRAQIDQFNQLVVARNKVALEQNELAKAIDSRPSNVGSR